MNRNLIWALGLQTALIAGLFLVFAASYSGTIRDQQFRRGREYSAVENWLRKSPTPRHESGADMAAARPAPRNRDLGEVASRR